MTDTERLAAIRERARAGNRDMSPDVPWLLAEVERLEDALAEEVAERDVWHHRWQQLMADHEEAVQERDRAEAALDRVRRFAESLIELRAALKGDAK